MLGTATSFLLRRTLTYVFALMHWGSGPGRLIYTFVSGALYMVVYLHLDLLWPLVAAHWIQNFLAFGPWDL